MNILHLKYAVEIAKTGSLNKAAEVLLMGQPNLSRAIKELESSLGITIFDRTAKGMVPTMEGEKFLGYAQKILQQIDDVERLYRDGGASKQKFSVSVPRACYIADAFANFCGQMGDGETEYFYKETNSSRAIDNILHKGYNLGIIRYAENYDKYFKEMLKEKGFKYEVVTEFNYVLIMRNDHRLATKKEIMISDLNPFIEIAHADPYVPSLSLVKVKKEELLDNISRRIFVFERASQLELLSRNSETFMWVSPVPRDLTERYGLVQRKFSEHKKKYKDVLIYRKDYRLTELDRQFIAELEKSRDKCLGQG